MKSLKKNRKIAPFVKDVILVENSTDELHELPFYADGYPGIMYSETAKGVLLLPLNKIVSNFFLYGQTIEPIQLRIDGAYKLVVFQLYPFATRLLLNIDPKEINYACYSLHDVEGVDAEATIAQLLNSNTEGQVEIVSDYILQLVKRSATNSDTLVKFAISTIIDSKGLLPIKELREQLFITERTFERRFLKEIGVTPKQFSRIIQFNFSFNQIKESDYTKLTNIAFDNGYSDQSHFIRAFKKYTGSTPKEVLRQLD